MMKTIKRCQCAKSAIIAFGVALTSAVGMANAADLEEIIVTAQKKSQSLQDVPVSVSVVTGEKLNRTQIRRAEDLSALIPNFSVQQDPIGDKINIRGIQSGNNAGLEQSVSTFVDGVYRGRGVQGRFAFLDVERIEVLRGPQGTLFGKNTIGGAISITSGKPTEEFEGMLSTVYTFENLTDLEVKGHVSGALSDDVRGRFAFQTRDTSEGYINNIYYDDSSPKTQEIAGRGTIEWDINDTTLLTAKLEAGDFEVDGQNHSILKAGPLAGLGVVEGNYREANIGAVDPFLNIGSSGNFAGDSTEASVNIVHQMSSGELKFTTAYSAYDFDRACDCDYSPLDILRFDDKENFEQFSLELNYASQNDGMFNYQTGAYFLYNELLATGEVFFNTRATPGLGDVAIDTTLNAGCVAAGGNPGNRNCILSGLVKAFDGTPLAYTDFSRLHTLDQDDTVGAVYFKGNWELSDNVTAAFGLRYTVEEKTATQSVEVFDIGTRNPNTIVANAALYAANGAPGLEPFTTLGEAQLHSNDLGRTENSLTWSANIQWHVSDLAMLYANASTGFKAGGFNSFALSSDPREAEFEEEEVLSFEVGAKLSLLDGAAELNIAAFQSKFDDIQTSLFTGATSFIVQNASEATSRGIELDGRWAATENLTLSGGVAYVNFEFDSYPNAGCYAEQLLDFRASTNNPLATLQDCSVLGINDLSGRTSENTPEISASLGLQHSLAIGNNYRLETNVDLIYQDEQYRQADLDPVTLDEAFFKMNLATSFGPEDGRWSIGLIVKNLTDEESFAYANDTPLVDGARQFIPDLPRTIAISGTLRF